MAIYVALDHRMRYKFDRPVHLSPHVIRLHPAPHARTPVHDYRMEIHGPKDYRVYHQQDPFGNVIARVIVPDKTTELEVRVHLTADMTVINPFDFFVESYAENFPFRYDQLLRSELSPYLEVTEKGPLLKKWVANVDRRKRHIVDFLVELNAKLQRDIDYTVRMEPGIQTCETTLKKALGSCRDTGWLLVQILRHLGLAARFASGYLIQLKADEKSLDGPSGTEHDFTDLHAWAEVYVPGAGWIGLDPTSGLFAGEGHIPLCCTPDPVSAVPLSGATDKCEVEFDHVNDVSRFHEDPRVTRPYSDAQWEAIRSLGRAMDQELQSLDVRLTMGGEPTFVSIDDMEGAEWTTAALGQAKRERAGVLLRRLQQTFAPGGLLHYGMGKWYPGEPLPRWALGCYWRHDGRPLWRDARWLADEHDEHTFGPDDAKRFTHQLASNLGLASRWVVEGREDWTHYLWREATAPDNYDAVMWPGSTQFRDDMGLALRRGLDQPVGYALPLSHNGVVNGVWSSGTWEFPRGAMLLTPGSSPMGLRLPLNELPWARWEPSLAKSMQGARPVPAPAPAAEAPSGTQQPAAGAPVEPPSPTAPPAVDALPAPPPETLTVGEWGWWAVPHTALCVEAREGKLHVFMPRFVELHPYTQLLESVEMTAAQLRMPVIIEGYEPPRSPDVQALKVTPDPGVIEVNIHPATSWEELEENTVTLYEQARLSRLGTEKFMLDGRHTGTGGGNHVTLGGHTPADSPFLRRPDLLRSFITYWQHHPSLSYLFSGLFIGPTSQAPRVDERGSQHLAELECSFEAIDQGLPAELIDGSLRNFLTDLVGNTHRAEFCIDKLYSSDSSAGRQGLLEFRGFEMPPHARMSLAQTLLVRTLVVRFWKNPYRHPLVRWGTALHDQFMLPEAIWDDFEDVIADCNAAGYPFALDWFDPFLEFRFPVYGRASYDGVDVELRMALEPWPVLGDPNAIQGQSRDVDSSVERMQVKARGLDPARHVLTCNGRRLPLRPTGRLHEYYAGVRYKAYQDPLGLHPTLPGDAPLVVDLFDRRLGRSVGGCVYHCDHPGGRNYAGFPVNPFEAEARRIGRFWSWGHTPGDVAPPPWIETLRDSHAAQLAHAVREPAAEPPNPEFPYTLDLRRAGGQP